MHPLNKITEVIFIFKSSQFNFNTDDGPKFESRNRDTTATNGSTKQHNKYHTIPLLEQVRE